MLAAALLPLAAAAATVERRLGLMGTSLTLEVAGADRAAALQASEAAVRAIEAAERRLSTWRADSELARLNRAPLGAPVPLSEETARELRLALECARETSGAFDPTLGALVDAWDLRGEGRVPRPDALAAAMARTGHGMLQLQARQAARHGDLRVEEGGFGKGAALDRSAEVLQAMGASAGWVDLGGQVLVYGREATMRLAHPSHRDRAVALLRVPSGSVATSGNSERGRVTGGRRVGHVLDPRTGQPARELGALAVWAPSGLWADCLSTGLYVLGPEAALAWARARPGVEVALLEEMPDGGVRVRASAGLRGRLSAAAPGVQVFFDGEGEMR